MTDLHSLLRRQLTKAFGSADAAPDVVLEFVRAVDEAYKDCDVDRQMLERSLDISSRELMEVNRSLRTSAVELMDAKEAQLRAAATRNESLAVLAGGIAHDFNNMLTVVLGNLSLLRMMLPEEERATELIRTTEAGVVRAVGLTRQLLTFATGGSLAPDTQSIEELLREATHFALRGTNVRGDLSLGPGLRAVNIDATQITQVIQNLIINAHQAMPDGGVVTVSAENVDVKDDDARPVSPGPYVLVTIRDTGHGIPDELLHRVFDPYFTTKEGGSGLGLATSYTIVARHGGFITATSVVGEGSQFQILLPAAEGAPASARHSSAPPKSSGRRLLVLDDDREVASALRRMLQFLGHDVRVVHDGAAAITEFRSAHAGGSPYDAVITDLTVPGGMGGREVVRHLRPEFPDLRAVASSGHAIPALKAEDRDGFVALLPKPYRLEELRATIDRVFSGR